MLTVAEAVMKYVASMARSSNYRNLCTMADKMLGRGEWKGEVYHLDAKLPMDQLRSSHIAALRDARLSEGLKPTSVNLELKILQRAHSLCRKEWDIPVPEVHFRFLKTQPKTRWLSPDEEQQVLAKLSPYPKAKALAIFLLDTGCRLGEALGLPWKDVLIDQGQIHVWRQKTKTTTVLGTTKRLKAVLQMLKLSAETNMVFAHMNRSVKKLRWAIDAVCNSDKLIIERHGRATIHSLRDTFASRLVQNGMTLHQVSKLLGHKSLHMTMKYAHLEGASNAQQAAAILEATQSGRQGPTPVPAASGQE